MSTFTLPELTYSYEALEPFIDATTMNIHHTKHHQAYINNLNAALAKHPELGSLSIEELNLKVATLPDDVKVAIRNNGGGHWNHSMFWKWMAPVGTVNHAPTGELSAKIDESFGSFQNMKEQFNQAAATRFGSGWAWLGVKPDGSLGIVSTPNQDNPMMVDTILFLASRTLSHASNKAQQYIIFSTSELLASIFSFR